MIFTGEFEVIANSGTILQKCGAPDKCSFVDVGKYETIKAELAKIFHISNAYSKNKEDETWTISGATKFGYVSRKPVPPQLTTC